jgi:hypothetical protein
MNPNYSPYEEADRPSPPSQFTSSPHHVAARGFAQLFALHPVLAIFIIVLDAMVSAIDVATLEITAPVLWLIAGIATFMTVFMAQKKWGGDDQESAFLKALMVSVLVGLPTPFPAFLTVPSAVVGFVHQLRKRGN